MQTKDNLEHPPTSFVGGEMAQSSRVGAADIMKSSHERLSDPTLQYVTLVLDFHLDIQMQMVANL